MQLYGMSWSIKNNNLVAKSKQLPLLIRQTIKQDGDKKIFQVDITAQKKVYFNFGAEIATTFNTTTSDFLLPGFWYHKNMRSPENAPSFKTAHSWNVREDRLSSPLTGVYNTSTRQYLTILSRPTDCSDALTTAQEGEVILSGNTSVGYVGFNNERDTASLTFGFPYIETPKRYIRKLTLTPSITTFLKLNKGEHITRQWIIVEGTATDYAEFVKNTWNHCFDEQKPQPLKSRYSADEVKKQLTAYFKQSFIDTHELKFNSGLSLLTATCKPVEEMEIGFCGRVLLNAFNEIEYGEEHNDPQLCNMGKSVFNSFLQHGFTPKGYLYDHIWYKKSTPYQDIHSIRQQSEAAYAILHFLNYEKKHGHKHSEWELSVRQLLDNIVNLQLSNGSFPRKFNDTDKVIDASGGSTPSATVPLVMGFHYFGNKKYLTAAKRSVDYLEHNIISKSDYFSSTLDANCEDKEAAISAVTATYYMTFVSKGKEKEHYTSLCRKAAYFALSWYYLSDVPFAPGQMLGELGLKTRGWSNVSVENNHIDVFVFEFASILKWLGNTYQEPRFLQMYNVIYTSLPQLMPTSHRLCGVALPGFYPEVVQHTTWDYGKNGKGFYNNYFAPGWTVASLWELYSPERTPDFFQKHQ